MSVTFLADGERAHVLGFNRLLTAAVGRAPFCYAGAISGADPAGRRAQDAGSSAWTDWCASLALRGLNGIDFLWDDGQALVLEINPRPTASFELYDPDVEGGLVQWHVRSFDERLGSGPPTPTASLSRGLQVVYAERTVAIPAVVAWPAWCHDLPRPGSVVHAGAPALSVAPPGRRWRPCSRPSRAVPSSCGSSSRRWHAQPAVTSEGIA